MTLHSRLGTLRAALFSTVCILVLPLLPQSILRAQQATSNLIYCGDPTHIIQTPCTDAPVQTGPNTYTVVGTLDPAIAAFEKDAITAWLNLHQLPASDATYLFQYGRSDLRGDLQLYIAQLIAGIINKAPKDRTTNEQAAYAWMANIANLYEYDLWQAAYTDAHSWQNNPCDWKPDPDMAKAYGFSYDGTPFCYPSYFRFDVPFPGFDYFYATAKKNHYYSPLSSAAGNVQFAGAQANYTVLNTVGPAVGGAAASVATVALMSNLLPFFGQTSGDTAAALIAEGTSTVVGEAPAALAVGPGLIIAIAIEIGQQAIEEFIAEQQAQADVTSIDNNWAAAQAHGPDLAGYMAASDGPMKEQVMVFNSSLVGYSSQAPLPAHRPGTDLAFVLTEGTDTTYSETFSYVDAVDGQTWEASTWNGWFVQKSPTGDKFNVILRVIDWYDRGVLVQRAGQGFMLSLQEPRTDFAVCPADSTGFTPATTDLTKCSVWFAPSFQYQGTSKLTVSLGTPPIIGDQPLFFPAGTKTSIPISTSGSPTPALTVGTLPSGFAFDGVNLIGNPGSAASGSFTATFTATNTGGTLTKSLIVGYGTPVTFVTPATIQVPDQLPFSYTIVTTGTPRPKVTFTGTLPPGLTFTSNNDGTGTLSGTAQSATSCVAFPVIAGQPAPPPCAYFTASNGTGDVATQTPIFQFAFASPAAYNGPSELTFRMGVPNQFTLTSNGATTPVTWQLQATPGSTLPPWVSYKTQTDGSLQLTGQPPNTTSSAQSVPIAVCPSALGSSVAQCGNVTLTVDSTPRFISNPTFMILANQNAPQKAPIAIVNQPPNAGTFSLTGRLPSSLSTTLGQDTSIDREGAFAAFLTGTPPVGSGGSYSLAGQFTSQYGQLTVNGVVPITVPSTIQLLVLEPASFASTPSSFTLFEGMPAVETVPVQGFPVSAAGLNDCHQANVPTQCTDMEVSIQWNQVQAMLVTIPPGVSTTDTTPSGVPGGYLRFTGTPAVGSRGIYSFTLRADNGVPLGTYKQAIQTFTLRVAPLPDLNGDGVVNCADYTILKNALGSGNPPYNATYDLNGDGVFDPSDLSLLGRNVAGLGCQ